MLKAVLVFRLQSLKRVYDMLYTVKQAFEELDRVLCIDIYPLCEKKGSQRVYEHICRLDIPALKALIQKENAEKDVPA